MMFKTHVVVSLVIALLLFPRFGLDKTLFLSVFLFASIMPDIDTPASMIGKRVKIIGWLFSHRGIFHSFISLIAFSTIAYAISPQIGLVFFIGYFSHLVIDMINYQGIKPFHPFTRFRIRGFVKTNSMVEYIIFIVCLIWGFVLL